MLTRKGRIALHRAETVWDGARFAVRKRLDLIRNPIIVPFRGYGDANEFWCMGRVIEDRGVTTEPHSESVSRNVWLTYKRYKTREISGVTVKWSFAGLTGEAVTDDEGYFEFSFSPGGGFDPEAAWQAVELRVDDAPGLDVDPVEALAHVRTPKPEAGLGIISDIDDTIVVTGAYDFLKHWRTVVANSAESRVPYPGIAPLYRAIADHGGARDRHPVFYVSSSPWNLFDLFERFMALNDIPLGPLMLKDFGLTADKWLTGGHDGHKQTMIARIMDRYPDMRFILVGDSGQRDAAIYAAMASERPDRVAAVFLREVNANGDAEHVAEMRRTLDGLGIPSSVGTDVAGAAGIARDAGWIDEAGHRAVLDAVAAEERESD